MHLLRASFSYAGRQHWAAIATALKPIYSAPTEAAALERFCEFSGEWGAKYPAIVRLWENAWAEFVPFLAFGGCCRIAAELDVDAVNRARRHDVCIGGGARASRCDGRSMDLHEVECGCRQVQFTGCVVQAAA